MQEYLWKKQTQNKNLEKHTTTFLEVFIINNINFCYFPLYYYLSNTEISNWSKPLNNSFIIAVIFALAPAPLPSTLSGILGSCKD